MGGTRATPLASNRVSSTTILALDKVRQEYVTASGLVTALDDVSLTIHRAELVAVIGVSGSGKTTLINVMAGLQRPTNGVVLTAGGVDLATASPKSVTQYRREVASVVFQEYNLMSMLTAAENAALPLRIRGERVPESLSAARAALSKLGLADLEERYPSEISGGQRQRVAIARAIAANAELLLADEPTGSLDSRTSAEVAAGLAELRATGAAVVVATHDPQFVSLADRVVYMSDGQIGDEPRR